MIRIGIYDKKFLFNMRKFSYYTILEFYNEMDEFITNTYTGFTSNSTMNPDDFKYYTYNLDFESYMCKKFCLYQHEKLRNFNLKFKNVTISNFVTSYDKHSGLSDDLKFFQILKGGKIK